MKGSYQYSLTVLMNNLLATTEVPDRCSHNVHSAGKGEEDKQSNTKKYVQFVADSHRYNCLSRLQRL